MRNMKLLQKIGECIACTICYLDDGESFKQILNKIQKEYASFSKGTLKIYLLIILKIIRDDAAMRNNKSKLAAVYTKEFKTNLLAQLMHQFEQEPKER